MSGLEGWWPLHDESGDAVDLSGNGNHGTVNGATRGVSGRGGLQSYSFDGSDDDIGSFAIGRHDDATLSLWVRPTTTKSSVMFKLRENNFYSLRTNTNDEFVFAVRDGSNTEFAYASFTPGNWYHVTATHTSDEFGELYLNGELKGTLSEGNHDNNGADKIGSGGTGYFQGQLVDVRVYSRALSPSEIQTLYEWGSGDYARPPTDGVSRYALDGDATDSWGTNDGTNNGVTFVSDAIRGQSGSFDGSSDISTPISSLSAPFSVCGWVKYNDLSETRALVSKWDSNNNGFEIGYDSGSNTLRFMLGSSGYNKVLSNTSPPLNDWLFVCGTYDGTTASFYTNGILRGQSDIPYSDAANDVTVGNMPTYTNYLSGNGDDVRIYDYALSPSEVFELYQWGTFGRDMRKLTVNQ